MMRSTKRELAAVIRLVGALLIAGCSSSHTPDKSAPEHAVIPHKPTTFAGAVAQIQARHARLASQFKTADPADLEQQLTEQLDILGWLPQLAAASPMKKADWDQVNAASKELLTVYRPIVTAAHSTPRGAWADRSQRIDELTASLATLIPASWEATHLTSQNE